MDNIWVNIFRIDFCRYIQLNKNITSNQQHLFITQMKINVKNKEFSRSLKYFNKHHLFEYKSDNQVNTIRNSLQQKMDLLKKPAYQRKKSSQKTIYKKVKVRSQQKPKTAVGPNRTTDDERTKQSEIQTKNHYRYKNNYCKPSFHSWFRKTSFNLQETKTKKNVVDVVVMEKEFDKDILPFYQKNSSMINLKQKHSKSLQASQDSQSLLRKNSLYLLNFIKRKENLKKQQPHIGGIPNLAQNIPISYSPTKLFKYVPTKSEKKKKPQKIIPTFSKIINNMPIDPW